VEAVENIKGEIENVEIHAARPIRVLFWGVLYGVAAAVWVARSKGEIEMATDFIFDVIDNLLPGLDSGKRQFVHDACAGYMDRNQFTSAKRAAWDGTTAPNVVELAKL